MYVKCAFFLSSRWGKNVFIPSTTEEEEEEEEEREEREQSDDW
jgi:hypothetical protein